MNEAAIHNDANLARVLWACYRYWCGESLSPAKRRICYSWVIHGHKERFGVGFRQTALRQLAREGFLQPLDTSRGGSRRYYAVCNPARVADLLGELNVGGEAT